LYRDTLFFVADSRHIQGMARSPKKSSAPEGFGEAPQADFEGVPYEGNVSDWLKQIEQEAEASTVESRS